MGRPAADATAQPYPADRATRGRIRSVGYGGIAIEDPTGMQSSLATPACSRLQFHVGGWVVAEPAKNRIGGCRCPTPAANGEQLYIYVEGLVT